MSAETNRGAVIVSLHDVYKVYELGEPVPVLERVSLDVPTGSYTAVMGPSGSGKSTLLHLIGCLDTPTSGRIEIEGVDVTGLSHVDRTTIRRDQIGFIFQTFNLMPRLTAIENVTLPLVFSGVHRDERRARAADLLARVDLADRGEHRPSELSGGQRQRVAIARALANDPGILLADEPTGSLDSETERQIMQLFEQLHDAGNTIFLVTHERHIAEHAERIVHVLDGAIEQVEEIEDRRFVAD